MDKATFPFRLYNVLEKVSEIDDESSIISWTPAGRTFHIHDLDAFKTRILPKYFPKQSKYKSFRRQLQYYGFFTIGWNHFGHLMFVRNQEQLLVHIKHKKGKTVSLQCESKVLSMVTAHASFMQSAQARALEMSLARQRQIMVVEEEQSLQTTQLPISSSDLDSTNSSIITSYLRSTRTQSLTASSENATLLRHQKVPRASPPTETRAKQQLDLALLALVSPQRSGHVTSAKLQNAVLPSPEMVYNQALLMSAKTDSDFIQLARFQLGL